MCLRYELGMYRVHVARVPGVVHANLVCGLWFGVWGLWFVVCGLWFVVCGSGFVVCGLWFVVCGLGFGVWGLGIGVWGVGVNRSGTKAVWFSRFGHTILVRSGSFSLKR